MNQVPKISGAGYNWREQWYPVSFARDLPEGQPQRVWLFDEAIMVLRRPGKAPMALLDRCPHRAAALSEGRMTANGDVQCAYHGWTFNEAGSCVNIPQVAQANSISGKTCAIAMPCAERQGMVWVYPSPGASPSLDTIAALPELDEPGWTSDDFVRDMPVDYTLLVENLADPDHGLFAHQTATFDSFTASAQYPMRVTTEAGRSGPKVVGRVSGVLKMTGKSEDERRRAMHGEAGSSEEVTATLEFEPPAAVRWARLDTAGRTKFITAFYAVPAGFGRSRFLTRYARSIAPWFHPPRWLFAIFLNAFLDQDTNLLATQQEVTLSAELAAAAAAVDGGDDDTTGATRHQMFTYRSPTDNLLVSLGRWLDKAVPLMPNRYRRLEHLPSTGVEPQLVAPIPREQVLDRWTCHTLICPDSLRAYNNLTAAGTVFKAATAAAAVGFAASLAATNSPSWRWALTLALSGGLAIAAQKLAAQFGYVYTPARQAKDLKRIPALSPDKF